MICWNFIQYFVFKNFPFFSFVMKEYILKFMELKVKRNKLISTCDVASRWKCYIYIYFFFLNLLFTRHVRYMIACRDKYSPILSVKWYVCRPPKVKSASKIINQIVDRILSVELIFLKLSNQLNTKFVCKLAIGFRIKLKFQYFY